jgi:predicted metal-dependent enzyme (double-stranded beta helix superfamily)
MSSLNASFDLERFIADCIAARADDPSHKAVREVLARAVSRPSAVLDALGPPSRAGLHSLYRSPELTILNLVWGPGMTLMPHNHRMWAVIGIYSGREDNIFWRRVRGDTTGRIEAAAAKALCEKDAEPLGRDIIHSVTNPIGRCTAALHIYGGDFFAADRSEWDPETLQEQPYDIERVRRIFDESNTRLSAGEAQRAS